MHDLHNVEYLSHSKGKRLVINTSQMSPQLKQIRCDYNHQLNLLATNSQSFTALKKIACARAQPEILSATSIIRQSCA